MKILIKVIVSILIFTLVITNSFTYVNYDFDQSDNYDYVVKSDDTINILWCKNSNQLETIIIPETIDGREVTSISNNAYDCIKATSIIITDSVSYISENAFLNCGNVVSLKWPSTCEGDNCFVDLNNLNLLSISYGTNGFMRDFTNNYSVPWFESNNTIKTLIIEDGIRYLGNNSFALLTNLKEVQLSENIESIGEYCFYNSNLPDISFSNTLQSIKAYGLYNINKATIYLNRNISYLAENSLSKNNLYYCFNNSYSSDYIKQDNYDNSTISLDFTYDNYDIELGSKINVKIDNESLVSEQVKYYSADQAVATIDQNGNIKTIKNGSCDIYAFYQNGSCKTTINITSGGKNYYFYRMINQGKSFDLKNEIIENIDFTQNNITYSSSNNKIVKVSKDGVIKGISEGLATVSICQNNQMVNCLFDVGMYVTSISTAKSVVGLKKGASYNLQASVSPNKANNKLLTYISDNPEIAVVNSNGKITGLNNGTCNITILSNDGSQISKTVIVNVSTSSIESARDIYIVGANKKTPLRVNTSSTSELVFVSSDNDIAYVENGYIIGVNEGKCYINIYDTSNTAYYSVKVACYDCYQMGIDISEWNGRKRSVENFIKIKNEGIEFVYIRAAYDNGYKDPIFEKNYKYAKEAGLNIGAYHYICSSTINGAIKEAKWMLKAIKGKQFEYPIMIDIEASVHKKLDKDQFTALVDAYCKVLEDNGYMTIVYSYASLLNRYKGERDCWVANWDVDYPSSYKSDFTIWQYSSKGSINGIYNRVDLNISFFDYPSYIKENHYNGY